MLGRHSCAGSAAEAAEPCSNVLKDLQKEAKKQKLGKAPVDSLCPLASSSEVHQDYDAMLNQTNIGANNNKFYVIQVLKDKDGKFYAWNRWGRVGEPGQNTMKGPVSEAEAIKDFEKKFQDKTKNKWADRSAFKPAAGKYMLIEIDHSATATQEAKLAQMGQQCASPPAVGLPLGLFWAA